MVLDDLIPLWTPKLRPKLTKFSSEKCFFKSEKIKSSLLMYLNTAIQLTLLIQVSLCFCQSNQNYFHVMFPPVFTSYFQLASSVRFIHRHWFWRFLYIFILEDIDSKNIKACFKDVLNVNRKFFSGSFASKPQNVNILSVFASQKNVCPN